MRLQAGQKIGERYTLRERIGSGGMADVWLADDATLGRRVALKFLRETFSEDAQFVERFRREASAAARLQHPNIVGVFDRGEFEGSHFIAMEYVEGASLKELINRGLSVAESIEIARQILAAARFAHERGIVHRDLKPQNVLIDAEGRARVADFGIARASASSEITQTGSVLGTAQYLSPEQAQGLETTAASDLYSIGIILYEELTGKVPFDGDSAVAVALRQVSEQPRPPSQIKPSVPRALDGVVLKALAKDPAERFASAAEFSRALDAAEADPTSGATSLQPAAAAAVGAAAGAAVAAAATPDAASAPPPNGDEPDEEERSWFQRNKKYVAMGVIVLLLAAVIVYALTRKSEKTVPDVKGQTEAQATAELEDNGFAVFPDSFESCDKAGTVSEQDPRAGSDADEGSKVTITVSKGLKVMVPNVVGTPQQAAVTKLQKARLLPKTTSRFSSSVKSGDVISTDPPAGARVECNAPVAVVVSKGTNLATVPDVTGLDQTAATTKLREAGFRAKISTKDSDQPEGIVIEEAPGPGSNLPVNSKIALTVSTGAGSVVVPNVIGQPEKTAESILQGRGARKIKVVERETSDESQDGNVLDQAPSSGTRIVSTEQVTIFVGKFVDSGGTSTASSSTSTSSTSTNSTAGGGT